jgi:CheY-like chemotaxis protein/signal transduction histidine kinase
MSLRQVKDVKKTQGMYLYILVMVIVLAFALMVTLSSYFMTDIVRKQLIYNAQSALNSLETDIKTDLKEPRTVLGNQSDYIRTMILRGAGKEEVRTYLNDITRYILKNEDKQLLGFRGLFGFFNVFGGELLDGQNRPAPENYNPYERPWYMEAVAAGGEIIFLHPHIGALLPDTVITCARGLFDDEGNLLGVVAMDMGFQRIREYVINENSDSSWFGVLLNEQYEFIAHREPLLEGTKLEDMNSDSLRLVDEMGARHDISEFRMRNHKNVPSITFIRKLENGWYLGIVTPEAEYFLEVKKVRFILMILGAMLSIIFSSIMIRIVKGKQEADAEKEKTDVLLKEANNQLANIHVMEKVLNSLDAIIYITNPQTGEILFLNDNCRKYYRVFYDCIGELCYKVFQKEQNSTCSFCPCHKLDKNPEKIIEWIEYNADKKRHYRNRACYITWPGGILAHLLYSVDITELYAAKEQAIQANRVKSDFLARMSHEIRSPMNAILGIIEIELDKDLPPDTDEALNKVHNSGYMLLNIINDILDLSKIESGKMEILPVEYDVSSMINDTVQLNLMRFGNSTLKLSLEVDEHVPAKLFGDDLRIKQVLNNLISNSFKYTKVGGINVSVRAEVSGSDNAKSVVIIFCIKDTGLGMTKEQVSKLFDGYARFNSEANRQVEGTGLGMPITNSFMDMMKGALLVESEPGKGSTFTIRIPQGYINADVLGKENAENLQKFDIDKKIKQKKGAQIKREYMPYGKVLVVDDMEPNLYVAKGLLAPYGLSIDTALSGKAAIDIVKGGQKFDVIFMDHYMPEMDGIEATKIIRELGYKGSIIALTANALVGQDQMYLSNGFDGFMSKPIDTRQLNSMLNRFVRDKYPSETIEAARKLKKKLEKGEDSGPPDLSKIKALVVDDFIPNLSVAQGMLQEYKMQVDGLSSGQEAVERIEKGEPRYDIIFMDLMMPGMDGMEATRLIRSLSTEYGKKVPIVALTAIITSETSDQEKMLLEKGFQAVLYKPLSVAKLDAFIKDWINGKLKGIISPNKKEEEKDMEIDIPGVDVARVEELYGGNMRIYLPVLRSYLSVIPEELEKISNVSQETLPDYVIRVHGVKSTSDSIGAEQARQMALELEMAGKAGDLATIMAKNEALIKYVKDLLVNIQKWLAKVDAQ